MDRMHGLLSQVKMLTLMNYGDLHTKFESVETRCSRLETEVSRLTKGIQELDEILCDE